VCPKAPFFSVSLSAVLGRHSMVFIQTGSPSSWFNDGSHNFPRAETSSFSPIAFGRRLRLLLSPGYRGFLSLLQSYLWKFIPFWRRFGGIQAFPTRFAAPFFFHVAAFRSMALALTFAHSIFYSFPCAIDRGFLSFDLKGFFPFFYPSLGALSPITLPRGETLPPSF